jgi:hypothetical protein
MPLRRGGSRPSAGRVVLPEVLAALLLCALLLCALLHALSAAVQAAALPTTLRSLFPPGTDLALLVAGNDEFLGLGEMLRGEGGTVAVDGGTGGGVRARSTRTLLQVGLERAGACVARR